MIISKIKTDNRYVFLGLLLFFISPLLSFFLSIRNYNVPFFKNIVWFFAGFLGYCLQVQTDGSGDSAVYLSNFLDYYNNSLNYDYLFDNFFSNRGHIEIVGNLIAMTVAQFTNNYHFLFLGYGLFFGYFFSRNISYMYENISAERRKGCIWITVAITFVIPIWNINGFDFWTASHVFIYGILPIIYKKKYHRVLFIALCPLIHFSFYFMIIISFFFLFIRYFKRTIVVIFILSFFVTEIESSQFSFVFNYFPEILVGRVDAYINGSKSNTGGNIIRFVNLLYSFSIYFVFYTSYINNKFFIEKDKNLERLYLYTFYIIGVFNVLSLIPSVGRFLFIGQFFLWVALFLMLNSLSLENYMRVYAGFNRIKIILILFWTISIIRYLFPLLGIGSFLSNPLLVWIFVNDDFVIGNFLDFLSN